MITATPALSLGELYQLAKVEDDDFEELNSIEQAMNGNMILEKHFRTLRDVLRQTAELSLISCPQTVEQRKACLLDAYIDTAVAILNYADRVNVLKRTEGA